MNHVDFASPPPLGTVVQLDEQEYELATVEPRVRADGVPSALLTWSTSCPDCQTEFEQKTGLVAKSLNRRCGDCRLKRHRPIKGNRNRRVKVRVTYP